MEDRVTTENVREKIREIFQSPFVEMNEVVRSILENLTPDAGGWLIKEIDEHFSDYKLTTHAFMYFYKEMKRAFHDMELDLNDLDSEVLEALGIEEDIKTEEKLWGEDVRLDKAIQTIGNLYPPDSGYSPEIGKEIMIEAIARNWCSLPLKTLETMAHLNIAKDDQS